MESNPESLWIVALALRCRAFSMENIFCSLALLSVAWVAFTLIYWTHPGGHAWGKHRWRDSSCLMENIPGPRGLPLLGSMSLMLGLAHRRIADAASSCGARRLMAFSLGDTRVIVTCNPNVAREILNSSVFADRPVKESAYSLMFNRAIGFAPYGGYWRTLRRIAATHLFCPKQIRASENQRRMISYQMITMLGTLNWGDHLAWLSHFDLHKIRGRCTRLVPKVNEFVNHIIAEHRAHPSVVNRDFVDVLLSLQAGPDKLSDSDMIAVLWEMIFRGTDTVAILMEWILARMVMHRDVQRKVQEELDGVFGMGSKSTSTVDEPGMAGLVYLTAVVKEVLRLHPPGPLLSWARLTTADTIVDGHHVPAGTTAMVNMWAISRDPLIWDDPLAFKPERFLSPNGDTVADVEFSVLGSDLRLAPFGSGRRTCPGKALALTTVTYWVASLLHEFDWLPTDDRQVDLSEVLKLSCEMANPLTVIPRPRCT
ncbi:hypothetical protein CDL15_Pgr023583 [Punica granatum]|uniref:Cytochrome P450 78A9-like n=1 Tax=Punica granatum TaxID=22663 RepID=A0A218W814_PUNGR|nr:hypothetical protein CDL15_Pgr023583 [Punica granatum]